MYTLFFPVTILTIIVIFRVKISNYVVVLLITPLCWCYVSYMISTFEYYGVPYTNLMFYLDIISILLIMFTIPIIMLIHIRNNQKEWLDYGSIPIKWKRLLYLYQEKYTII